MKYSRLGISFSLMREGDIEMVRQWRNDPVVASRYEFREYITPEMQREWFRKVNNIGNLYTILEYRQQKIGVINFKDIDWEQKTGEGGIFLPDPKYHSTGLPAIISCITTELIFRVFGWNEAFAHVLQENLRVQQFVTALGYELLPGQETVHNQKYRATRESFEARAARLKKLIRLISDSEEPGIFQVSASSFEDPLVLEWENKVRESPFVIRQETTHEGRFYYFG